MQYTKDSYFLGLFEADCYTWTGTFGITNRDSKILNKAAKFLSRFGTVKHKSDNNRPLRVYVSSRPKKREFERIMQSVKKDLLNKRENIASYFAGKYDGDGSHWRKQFRFKITYGKINQVKHDKNLLLSIGIKSKIREYKNANAFDLELSSGDALMFFELIKEESIKCPRGTTEFVL